MVRQLEKKSKEANIENMETSLTHYIDPVKETQSEVRLAYQAYVEAQKELLSAFREQEQQSKYAQKINEKRYLAYEEILEKAFRNREKAEAKALDIYCRTLEKAALVYRENIWNTLKVCQQTTDDAWRTSIAFRDPVTHVFPSKLKIHLKSFAGLLTGFYGKAKAKSVSAFHRLVRLFKEGRVARSNSTTR